MLRVPGYFSKFLSDISKVKAALIVVVVFTVVVLTFAYFLLPNHTALIGALGTDRSWFLQDETMAFTSVFAGSIFSALFLCFCIVRSHGNNARIGVFVCVHALFCVLQIVGLFVVYKTATSLEGLGVGNGFLITSQFGNGLLLLVAAIWSFPNTAISKFVGIGIGALVAATGIHNPSSLIYAKNNKISRDETVEEYLQNR